MFLKNIMNQENLNALAIFRVEKELVQLIPDLDNKVMASEERRTNFMYLKIN